MPQQPYSEQEQDNYLENRRKKDSWDNYLRARGGRYEHCRFSNFQCDGEPQSVVVDLLKEFAANPNENRNLILLGKTGTGKDHLITACVYHRLAVKAESICWTSGPELFAALRDCIQGKRAEKDAVDRLLKCELLVFSDLAMTTLTDYQREIVYWIVDRRYSHCLPIWLSANVASREAFEQATSVQIVSRLIDGALYVPCNWDSYRKLSSQPFKQKSSA